MQGETVAVRGAGTSISRFGGPADSKEDVNSGPKGESPYVTSRSEWTGDQVAEAPARSR